MVDDSFLRRWMAAVLVQTRLLIVAFLTASLVVSALKALGLIYTTRPHVLWLTAVGFLLGSGFREVHRDMPKARHALEQTNERT